MTDITAYYGRMSGMGEKSIFLQHISPWHPAMKVNAPMKFYKGNPEKVVDVTFGDNDLEIEVYIYPNTPDTLDIPMLVEPRKAEIRQQLMATTSGKFTFDLETFEPLTKVSFTNYFPAYDRKHDLFIFDEEESAETLPGLRILCCPRTAVAGVYANLFRIQAFASHSLTNGIETELGRQVIFHLLDASIQKELKLPSHKIDYNFPLPTNGKNFSDDSFKVEELQRLAEELGTDKLIIKNGKIVDTNPPKAEETDAVTEDLGNILKKTYQEKGYVNLSDVVMYGVRNTIEILPLDEIIPIYMDMAGVAKKMCIYQHAIHVVPSQDEFDLEMLFNDCSVVFEVSEEQYPKK